MGSVLTMSMYDRASFDETELLRPLRENRFVVTPALLDTMFPNTEMKMKFWRVLFYLFKNGYITVKYAIRSGLMELMYTEFTGLLLKVRQTWLSWETHYSDTHRYMEEVLVRKHTPYFYYYLAVTPLQEVFGFFALETMKEYLQYTMGFSEIQTKVWNPRFQEVVQKKLALAEKSGLLTPLRQGVEERDGGASRETSL